MGSINETWMVIKLSILMDVHQHEWYNFIAPLWMPQKPANPLEIFKRSSVI